MAIPERIGEFMRLPVRPYRQGMGLVEPASFAWRIGSDQEGSFDGLIEALLADPRLSELEALVIGPWSEEMFREDAGSLTWQLRPLAARLSSLRGLFFGDIPYTVCEISWIQQMDQGELLSALPALEEVVLRGGEGLRLTELRSETLRSLTVQAGGMSGAVVRDIVSAHLPNLEALELWLGTEMYGGSSTVEDLQPLLSGKAFPKLRRLGLMNCDYAGAVAEAVATAPVVERLTHLDLSMGVLLDRAASLLLESPSILRLSMLDVSDNYLSEEMVARFEAVMAERVVADSQKEREYEDDEDAEEDEDLYVSCGE